MKTTFINLTRPSNKPATIESFGEHQTVWREPPEILCPLCKQWTDDYGDVSIGEGDIQEWICGTCAKDSSGE